ncbi:MAG: hypothetical protein LUG98_09405 [Tannerellaceae bacterium]|nr:hypothetical protein [Tannerellaceae bacterium]
MKQFFTYNYLLVVTGILIWAGCTDDFERMVPPVVNHSAQGVFTLRLPKKNGVETRAMTEEQEYRITEITILAFENRDGTEQLSFYNAVPVGDIVRDDSDVKKYTIAAPLTPGTYSSILLLANSESVLAANASLLVAGTPGASIQAALIREVADGTKWNADGANSHPIPMVGEVRGGDAGITIKPGQAPFSSVPMTSMLARINVTNKEAKFELEEIYLYNFRRDGLIIPGDRLPTLPPTERRHSTPLQYGDGKNEIYVFEQDESDGEEESERPFMVIGGIYDGSGGTTWYRIDFVKWIVDDDSKARNEDILLTRNHGYNFVINEIKAKGYDSREDAAQCLPVNTVTEILVFNDGDVENILFDGEYFLAISLESMEFDKNAQTQILNVKTDNPLKWKVEKLGNPDWLSIDRTVPGPDDNGELEITVDEHTANEPRTGAFKITAGRLEYTLPVVQSNIEGISLEITGLNGEEISEVLFRSHPYGNTTVLNQDFIVRWKGPECKINVGMIGNRKINLPALLTQGGKIPDGQYEYTFHVDVPAPFSDNDIDPLTGTPFLEEGAAVTFEVENGTEKIQRTIVIRHQCVNIVFDNLQELCYMGHEYRFAVRSNTNWRITEAETEVQGLFKTVGGQDFSEVFNTTGGLDVYTGTTFTTRLEEAQPYFGNGNYAIGRAGRTLRLTFTDEDNIFPEVTKTFIGILPDANCYRVANGGGSINIPLRKLFWIWEKELGKPLNPVFSGGLGLNAELIWESSIGLLNNIELINPTSSTDYRDYMLTLRSSATSDLGNALIAIKNNNNETLWSFHIWVTNYFPDEGNGGTFINTAYPGTTKPEFMDYNLGATIDYTTGFNPHNGVIPPDVSPDINGLFYQHGRKDPFPGPAATLSSGDHRIDGPNPDGIFATLYAGNGTPWVPTFEVVNVAKNLENSIRNPTTYYNGQSEMSDWYTNLDQRSDQYDYFWLDQEGRKGMYDPCPEGWSLPTYKPRDMEGFENYHEFLSGLGSYVELESDNFYFPASGYYRSNPTNNGRMETRNYQTAAYLIFADPDGAAGTGARGSLTDGSERLITNSSISRNASCPVRCKKDTYNWYGTHY